MVQRTIKKEIMKQELIDMLLEYYGELMQERDSISSYNWLKRDEIIRKMNAIDLILGNSNEQETTVGTVWKTIKKKRTMNPKSELASKLKDILSKMSQEEFDKEWSKVTSLNLESPSFEETMEQSAVIFIRDWVRTNGEMSEDGQSITYSCKDIESIIEQANKKFEKQIIESWIDGNSALGCTTPEKYFALTYGSKGSDEIKGIGSKDINGNEFTFSTSSQTEISDEDIEKAARETYREYPNNPKHSLDWHYNKDINCFKKQKAFKLGAKWYREQLKSLH